MMLPRRSCEVIEGGIGDDGIDIGGGTAPNDGERKMAVSDSVIVSESSE